MRSNLVRVAVVTVLLSFGLYRGYSQRPFVNLDFEHPILPLVADPFFQVPVTNALPGWTAYIGGNPVNRVVYDTVSLGAAAISFHDTASSRQPIEGNYSLLLQGSSAGPPTTAAVGQTGQIPSTTRSLIFYGAPSPFMLVTFDGQPISLITLATAPEYYVMGADISSFAGQSGELRFQGGGPLDNIQFSTQPVPEPSTWALIALATSFLGACRVGRQWRRATS